MCNPLSLLVTPCDKLLRLTVFHHPLSSPALFTTASWLNMLYKAGQYKRHQYGLQTVVVTVIGAQGSAPVTSHHWTRRIGTKPVKQAGVLVTMNHTVLLLFSLLFSFLLFFLFFFYIQLRLLYIIFYTRSKAARYVRENDIRKSFCP